jgi:acetoacetate decarboxylase
MAYLYLDSDTAIAAGREIWGFPKKYARFPSSVREDILTKKVERGGVELFKISLQSMKPGKKEDLVALRNPIFNLKIIPSVRKGAPADVMQLTATTLQNFIVHRVMEGSATIEFGRSTADPVYLLQTIEVIKGLYCELDFDLPHGEVIYEYGEPPKEKRSAASS